MANFSTKERLIASFLSATPGLKRLVKQIYITINAVIYHKDYNAKILDSRVNEIVSFILTRKVLAVIMIRLPLIIKGWC